MPIIQTVNVTKVFGEGAASVAAVRGVDLAIRAGEMVALVGPSGSGKSTLLSLLGAIDSPTSGRVLLEGVDTSTLNDTAKTVLRRRRIGFVFQSFNLIPTLSAIENVALPLELDGIGSGEAQERAAEALRSVALQDRMKHLPSMMSGGEQQRVAIARALVIKPAIVLADEPTGNLDSVNSSQIASLLRDLVDQRGQTVVLVTHEEELARRVDRVIQLKDGRSVEVESAVDRVRPG